MTRRRPWTAAEVEVLRARYPNERTRDIARDLGRTEGATWAHAKKLGLAKSERYLATPTAGRILKGERRGVATQFHAGQTSWNKGTHFTAGGRSAETRFKPGQAPHNERPIGSYRIDKDGTLQRKYSNARGGPSARWRSVHRMVWEEANGPTPRGYVVVFRPGMRTNVLEEITLDRVELVSRREHMARHTVHRFPEPLRQVIQLKGAVQRQINKRTKAA